MGAASPLPTLATLRRSHKHYSSNILRPLVIFKIIYLGMSKLILRVIHINRPQELLSSFLVVNELSLRYHTSIQYFVPTRKTLVREKLFNSSQKT